MSMVSENVHKGRFGYYPCDYETFKKLKALHKLAWKALYETAAFNRWYRKEPQNRVIRKKIRNSAGQVVGYAAPVARPQPQLTSPFGLFGLGGNSGFAGLAPELEDVISDYRNARMPRKTPEEVRPLRLSMAQIDEFLAKAAA